MEWLLSCLLLGTCLTVAMCGDPWPIGLYPNPRTNPEQCNRPSDKPSFVCDPDGLLSRDEADQLDLLLEDIRNKTKCPCSRYQCYKDKRGYQIGITLVDKMEMDEGDSDIEQISANLNQAKLFAYTNLQRWENMGQCDENVMIFYSSGNEVLYTMTGENARRKLSNGKIGYISMAVRSKFGQKKKDAYFTALKEMVEAYRSVFKDEYVEPSYAGSNRVRAEEVRGRSGAASAVASTVLLLTAGLVALKSA